MRIRRIKRFDARERKPRKVKEKIPKTRGYPLSIERRYQRTQVNYIREYYDILKEVVIPRLPELVESAKLFDTRKTDSRARGDGYVFDFMKVFAIFKATAGKKVPDIMIERDAQNMAINTDGHQKKIFDGQFKSVLGVVPFASEPWLTDVLQNTVQKNVTLIKSAHETYFKDIETFVLEGLDQGQSAKDIGAKIAQRTGVSESKGRLIARDQVAKLNTSLASRRATSAGVVDFIWSSSLDERVRPSHAEIHGKRYSYEKGANVDGVENVLPGQPINCRCVGIPVISSIPDEF